jgi:hypothetical protein
MSTSRQPQACFYCGDVTDDWEKDHFPKPREVGGTEVVCACIECHKHKDTHKTSGWRKTLKKALDAEWGTSGDEGPVSGMALVILVTVNALNTENRWPWVGSPNDELLFIFNSCESWEMRVFLAKLIRLCWIEIAKGATCTDEDDRVVDRRVEWQCELRKKPAA